MAALPLAGRRLRIAAASEVFSRVCRVCSDWKPAEAFPVATKNVPARSGRCKACLNEYRRARRVPKPRPVVVPKPRKSRASGEPRKLQALPPTKQCVMCGETKPREDFGRRGTGRKRDSRCKVCHYARKLGYELEARTRKREVVWRAIGGPLCVVCGEDDPVVMHFHHIDPATKSANVSKLFRDRATVARILEEISKCAVLCANCHLRVHAGTVRLDRGA